MTARREIPALSLVPRGLSRELAAAYVGVSPNTYSKWVESGLMPKPKRVGGRVVWDRQAVDLAFSALPGDDERNPWDDPE
ncbi:helix-turn-helix transcriptional regulator [Oceanibacterium hippocampi]|uniref:HTH cro/C1-type domain-containing protein n=1 Tax=Oceanibacterium hippocampi TaxID=745714 RepID=A0A1Y5TYY4_9PROT|nr:helix-turn-helix transcriptional regulator [Oceanibacterium hippocampi]SLN77259.1 hypothetical protein OCH7691_04354 [Oceanibacterium hippocampi]